MVNHSVTTSLLIGARVPSGYRQRTVTDLHELHRWTLLPPVRWQVRLRVRRSQALPALPQLPQVARSSSDMRVGTKRKTHASTTHEKRVDRHVAAMEDLLHLVSLSGLGTSTGRGVRIRVLAIRNRLRSRLFGKNDVLHHGSFAWQSTRGRKLRVHVRTTDQPRMRGFYRTHPGRNGLLGSHQTRQVEIKRSRLQRNQIITIK